MRCAGQTKINEFLNVGIICTGTGRECAKSKPIAAEMVANTSSRIYPKPFHKQWTMVKLDVVVLLAGPTMFFPGRNGTGQAACSDFGGGRHRFDMYRTAHF